MSEKPRFIHSGNVKIATKQVAKVMCTDKSGFPLKSRLSTAAVTAQGGKACKTMSFFSDKSTGKSHAASTNMRGIIPIRKC